MSLAALLPDTPGLVVEQVILGEQIVTVVVRLATESACCPCCAQPSSHIHSYARRTLVDLPMSGRQVHLSLQVGVWGVTEQKVVISLPVSLLHRLSMPLSLAFTLAPAAASVEKFPHPPIMPGSCQMRWQAIWQAYYHFLFRYSPNPIIACKPSWWSRRSTWGPLRCRAPSFIPTKASNMERNRPEGSYWRRALRAR